MPKGKMSAKSTEVFVGAIQPGDIVLVQTAAGTVPAKLKRVANTKGQRMLAALRRQERVSLKGQIVDHSHVMLGVGNGLVIHADGKSVTVQKVSDALANSPDLRYVVYRRRGLSDAFAKQIAAEAVRYYGRKYDFTRYFQRSAPRKRKTKDDTTQFCSRLVSHAYRSAGVPLSTLADNRVLPLDLYKLCQSADWDDVTKSFVADPDPSTDALFGEIDLPGIGKTTFNALVARLDASLQNNADLAVQQHSVVFETTKQLLIVEALLAMHSAAQFKLAKAYRISPASIDSAGAQMIAHTLEQIAGLLPLAHITSLDVLVPTRSFYDVASTGDRAPFVGFPTATEVRSMQENSEVIRIYTYLFFLEIGTCSVLAKHVPQSNLEIFRGVAAQHVERFERAVPASIDLSRYDHDEYDQDLFAWATSSSDRDQSRRMFRNIVQAMKVIAMLREACR